MQGRLPLSGLLAGLIPVGVDLVYPPVRGLGLDLVAGVLGDVTADHVDGHHEGLVAVKLHQEFSMVLVR